ncbi:MAG: 5'-methylthioadenosine/adenosylhomocysteine nucleosidase [Streptococcaceae bacterium]|jgi:adenosylhomocysteine nucleosidase|nr:5'-methylthioadenosine/adenosylhomocysteine nucleosidase [Streptococcaceae bacterium]
MKIGIIAAMPEEIKLLSAALINGEKRIVGDFIFNQGVIGRHEVVLVESGIGKVMSSIAATLLITSFKVDGLIHSGSAGAVAKGISIGDVVIATELAYHDVDVTGFGYKYGQLPNQPLYFESSKYFVSELGKQIKQSGLNLHQGLIVTGDSFINSSQKIENILSHFPSALAIEMEGASVAQTALAFSKPFVVVRAISDTADHQATESFDHFILEAGRNSAKTVIQLLEAMI